ncbi:unnamed protein product [marine sediment metagenome]|uniref:Uncharacterized protein n=1 Tax=marine sediment metagenome TaxID=412755 RepID=X0S623_9ZZZZ
MKNRLLVGLILGGALIAVVGAYATNGDMLHERGVENHRVTTYVMIDAYTGALTTGPTQYLGAYEAVSFYMDSGLDGSNTVTIECGIGVGSATAPTVWHIVHTSITEEAVRLEDGDACPWVRINKATTDGAAVTVKMVVFRARR